MIIPNEAEAKAKESARIADIRKRNEERKVAEQRGMIGGARANFDVDFLLRHIERLEASGRKEAK